MSELFSFSYLKHFWEFPKKFLLFRRHLWWFFQFLSWPGQWHEYGTIQLYKHIRFLIHRSSCVAVVRFLQNTFVECSFGGCTMTPVLIIVCIREVLSSLLYLAIHGRIRRLHSYLLCSKISDLLYLPKPKHKWNVMKKLEIRRFSKNIWKIFIKKLEDFFFNKHSDVLLKQWWLLHLNTPTFDVGPTIPFIPCFLTFLNQET